MNPVGDELLYYEDVVFRRDGREILQGVDWQVKTGENWALLGLNGAGKSTLLSMIPAYQMPTAGVVRVFGYEFGKYVWANIKSRIGFVSSSLGQFQSTLNKQVVEDVVISGAFSSIGIYQEVSQDHRERGYKLMESFGISYLAGHRYGTLSTGEQRRVLLARALMGNPDLLILDEPCSGLDLPAREQFLRTVEQMAKDEEKPYIYVSHQIDEIMPSITHVAILKDGRIAYAGKKVDILADAVLSNVFEIAVSVVWENERPWIIVK